MSDPVTNVEIEDVLSSIRRLVSDDARAPRRAFEADTAEPEMSTDLAQPLIEDVSDEPQEGAETQAPTALILTPALRVATEEMESELPQAELAGEVAPVEDVVSEPEHTDEAQIDAEAAAEEV